MSLPYHLVILGPQGSGKGTQAELLSKHFNMPMLDAGELSRKKSEESSELGRKVKNLIDKGFLIPFDVTRQLVEEVLATVSEMQTVIFSSYPRAMGQVKDFEEILEKRKIKVKKVVLLNIGEETTYQRLSGRRICVSCEKNYYPPQSLTLKECEKCGGKIIRRDDDNKDAIKKRLSVYNNDTLPVIKYFKKSKELIKINGEQSIEKVYQEILQKLSEVRID